MILDAPACAALLRCSVSHLNKLARQGILPASKVGRGWVFVEEDVLDWLRARSAQAITPKKLGRPRKRVV